MPTNNKSKKLCCSFCGRSETEVELLIPAALGGAAICGDCVMTCANFIEEINPEEVPAARGKADGKPELSIDTLPKPAEIKAVLAERLADQPCALFRLRVIIELSVLVRIEPREHTGARRHTQRVYGFAVGEADALAAQTLIGIQHRACAKRIFIMMKRNVVHGQPQNISISCSHKTLLPARHC